MKDNYKPTPAARLLQLDSLGKIPPQAIDLEEAVLGAVMLEKEALTTVFDILKPETFYKEAHSIIYEAILTLDRKKEPIDILTVCEQLKTTEQLEDVGGAYYISELTNKVASAANLEYHARIIQQKYIKRDYIRIAQTVIANGFDDSVDVGTMIAECETQLLNVQLSTTSKEYEHISKPVQESLAKAEQLAILKQEFTGIPSGILSIDRVTGGWQDTDLIIIAARPGKGKTALMLTLARKAAEEKPVGVFSLEMSGMQLVNRLAAGEAPMDLEIIRHAKFKNDQYREFINVCDTLKNLPIFLDDTGALNIYELRAKARRMKLKHDISILFVDYLQLCTTGDTKGKSRHEQIGEVSRTLKAIAKELKIPVIALSQLSRAVESRGGEKKPMLSDLKESGDIEQDADMVCFIWRPDYYKHDPNETVYFRGEHIPIKGYTEFMIAKHRNGSLEDIGIYFEEKLTKFKDYPQGWEAEKNIPFNANNNGSEDPPPF